MTHQRTIPDLIRTAKTLQQKAEHAAGKAEQFYVSLGLTLKELKERKPKGTTWPAFVTKHFTIGKTRADELIRIASGTTTVAEVREATREKISRIRAKRTVRTVQSAPAISERAVVTACRSAPKPDNNVPVYFGSCHRGRVVTVNDNELTLAERLDETSLGDPRELAALEALPEADRERLIAAALRGEMVTARTDLSEMEMAWFAFMEAAMHSTREDREAFYSNYGRVREVERLCDPTRGWRKPSHGDVIDIYAPFDQPVYRAAAPSPKVVKG